MRFVNTLSHDPERRYLFIMSFFLMLGSVLGCLYMMSKYGGTEDIKSWIDSYLANMKNGASTGNIFVNTLKNSAAVALLIFVCGFFKLGPLIVSAELARQGFVIGFTSASFIKYYGLNGLLLTSALMPKLLIAVPASLIFASISCAFALKTDMREKKIVVCYILFAVFIFAIFCISSICESFLSTIFMRWAANTVT